MPFSHPKLEKIRLIEPGRYALQWFERNKRGRFANLSDLKKPDGLCAWCNIEKVPNKRGPGARKYCSDQCRTTAIFWSSPQSPQVKMWAFLQRQDCTCPLCGEIFENEINALIERKVAYIASMKELGHYQDVHEVSYWLLGDNTGSIWQVDHVVPIHKGGVGIGLSNIQVVCAGCHLKKTIAERC